MTDKKISGKKTLYGKYYDDLRSNVAFGVVASILLLVLLLIIVANNFIFIKVYVSGSSMYPTLKDGDVVTVNRYAAPNYGDVIIVSGEKENGDWLIKRAIAFGGDTVRIEDGYVWLKKSGEADFTKLSEPYVAKEGSTFWDDPRAKGYLIEEGQIFYLGDNRTNSRDSRSSFGTCEKSQIVGVVGNFSIKFKGVNNFFAQIANFIEGLFA